MNRGNAGVLLACDQEQVGVFEVFDDGVHEAGRLGPVDDAMVKGERKRQNFSDDDLALSNDGLVGDFPQAENADFGVVDDGRAENAADHAVVRQRKGPAL